MRRLLVLLKNICAAPYRLFFTHISILAGLQEACVDRNAAICSGARFYRSTNCKIGAFTSISGDCYIGGTSHPLNWVSSSSVFHKWKNILRKNFAAFEYSIFKETEIGNDVWVGEGCKIKAGIHISDGSVIGMGSVLTKDVGPYEIWAGNPAKLIRKRFSQEEIDSFVKLKWWNWSDEKIEQYANSFNNPELFLKSCITNGEFNR